ncbi:MAG: hypothetical protein Q8R58_12635 [Sulfuricurvum sp.]|nr:hypothetical protein [Sulfuricurvum sp.]
MVKEFVVTKKEALLLIEMLILNQELHKRAMLNIHANGGFSTRVYNIYINHFKRLVNYFGENPNKFTSFYKNADVDIYKLYSKDFNEIFNLIMNNEFTISEEMCPMWDYSEKVLNKNKQFRLTQEMVDLYTKLEAIGFYECDYYYRQKNPDFRDYRRKMVII